MPQDTSQNYYYPDGTRGIPNETIESEAYNNFLDDLKINDLNWPRPIHRGGTGAITADQALFNLSAEKAAQLVTNYDSHVWFPGSFRSTNAPGQAAPVDGHAFSGICYINEPFVNPPTNQNVTVSARDMTDGKVYVRMKIAGVWGPVWIEQAGSITTITDYVDAMVDTDAGARRNRIINGAMQISQENTNTAGSTNNYYAADQWLMTFTGATSTAQRVQSLTSNGSKDRLRITIGVTSVGIAEQLGIEQNIEGNSVADFRYGAVTAKQSVLRFGWKGPAGTYSVSVRNSANNRTYLANFTITAGQANADTQQVIVISGDTTGTWLTDNGKGINLHFNIAAGANHQGATGWQAGTFLKTSANTNVVAIGNVIELFDVGLYLDIGNLGVAAPWEMPDPIQQLELCKRYFQKQISTTSATILATGVAYNTGSAILHVRFPVQMRAAPTTMVAAAANNYTIIGASGTGGQASAISTSNYNSTEGARIDATVSGLIAGQAVTMQTTGPDVPLAFSARL